jgi:hypothetical protein
MLKRVHRVDVPFPLCEAIETLSIRLGSLRTRRQDADQTDWYEELREALFSEAINFSLQSQLILCRPVNAIRKRACARTAWAARSHDFKYVGVLLADSDD